MIAGVGWIVRVRFLATALVAGLISAFPTDGETGQNRVAESGQEIILDIFYQFRPIDCKSFNITVKVADAPKNGKVRQGTGYADPSTARVAGGDRGRCHGKKIRSTVIYYRSKKGFRGRDSVSLRSPSVFGGRKIRYTINVN